MSYIYVYKNIHAFQHKILADFLKYNNKISFQQKFVGWFRANFIFNKGQLEYLGENLKRNV